MSARKVQMSGYDAFPLLTTTLKPEDMTRLTDAYDRVIVWLDNDNPVVKRNRDRIVRELSLLTKAGCVSDKTDPKEYSIETIREVLDDG